MEDHPRVCGEQSGQYFRICGSVGSPPRVRGTDDDTYEIKEGSRITPACAGNREMQNLMMAAQ